MYLARRGVVKNPKKSSHVICDQPTYIRLSIIIFCVIIPPGGRGRRRGTGEHFALPKVA